MPAAAMTSTAMEAAAVPAAAMKAPAMESTLVESAAMDASMKITMPTIGDRWPSPPAMMEIIPVERSDMIAGTPAAIREAWLVVAVPAIAVIITVSAIGCAA